jgi:hypothetical protein
LIGIEDWVCDLLASRGALVDTEAGGAIRAMLPPDVAAALGATDWLSLDFRPRPGGDDPMEWLDRLEHLLPERLLVAAAEVRKPAPTPPVDAASVLSTELAVQNGIYRLVGDSTAKTSYLFFTFRYTVESDDRSLGFVTVCFNAGARSAVMQPEHFWRSIRDQLQEAEPEVGPEVFARFCPAAAKAAQVEIRKHASRIEENSNRRLVRDVARVDAYYQGLLAQIEKRLTRRTLDAAAAEKERSRALATEADRLAKLEDLRRKYSLRIQIDLAAVLAVRAPVRQISVRLIRKRDERADVLDWNPVLRALESPLCEHCAAQAHPLFLCERIHRLCRECWVPCPACSRFFCRACQQRCKCGADPVPLRTAE